MGTSREKKAFEILAAEHAPMLTTYLRCLLNQDSAIDDLFQETMVVAWRRLDECDLSRPFGPWLRGIASRLVLAHYRKQKRIPVSLDETVLQQLNGHFEQVSARPGDTWDEKLVGLEECLAALPATYKKVIDLHYHQDEPIKQIAMLLEVSVETCKKRLQRARQRLANCLRSKGLMSSEVVVS